MALKVFTQYMLSKIAQALGSNDYISHDALDNIWMGFGDNSALSDSTKAKKANEMVQKISRKPLADAELVQILNEVFYHDAKADSRKENSSFKLLKNQLLEVGFTAGLEGFKLPSIDLVTQNTHAKPNFSEPKPSDKYAWAEPQKPWGDILTSVKQQTMQNKDPRKVFIVHGRDMETKSTLEQFLRYIEVSPLDWTEARDLTNLSAPTTLQIVQSGLNHAQAVIVIFTPDDEARLKTEYSGPYDGPDEVQVTGQARPNVILEAGMALGIDANRTVLVRRGKTRNISDIEGINWINLNNVWDDRKMLVNSLKAAGVTLNENRNFLDANAGSYS
ncbi:nucleotide-binding protein [Glutamicibacter halophytocola]|uniref:Nucleotide-binding protein n=1 Tax=Glutamicibacter halophytocola TaxID=1933880 RepID=A0AA94XVF1_9MICC|nr:nucleotide-binding protein [Glutamicibacter halophytocola]UUX60468.1 nucleotide-binding protein [Glutamicibacter halophytocola]